MSHYVRGELRDMTHRCAAACALATLLSACAGPAGADRTVRPFPSADISVVPQPAMLRVRPGEGFRWNVRVRIDAAGAQERRAAQLFTGFLGASGVRASLDGALACVHIRLNRSNAAHLGREGYALDVSPQRILLSANTPAGLFYGVQTLEQLTFSKNGVLQTAPALVLDRPARAWRGIHLDVSRHFFSVGVIERYLDVAAHYKLNVFHWHLTDDAAWRMEIPGYPRLVGAGPSYSAQDIRSIVRYANARAMTVVPEIELPGHNSAARRAYPQTDAFIEAVLRAVIAVFPGPYVHAGGDEVKDTAASSHMLLRAAGILKPAGRTTIVWDDALAAHLPAPVVVMAWHAYSGTQRALQSGHPVVASPDGPLYFDAYQGQRSQEPPATLHMATLEQVYDYSPPPGLLGIQANVWTERIATAEHLWYMTLPRELALAENAWDTPEKKNWESFMRRLPAQLAWLDARGYTYRVPNTAIALAAPRLKFAGVPGNPQSARAFTDAQSVRVTLRSPVRDATIRYWIAGGGAKGDAVVYTHPFVVPLAQGTAVEVRAYARMSRGRRSTISSCTLRRLSTQAFSRIARFSRSWSALVSP
ncbi:MAG: family 20 glycosylhydrolase [Vulcanimicrobiaceae bacterium]